MKEFQNSKGDILLIKTGQLKHTKDAKKEVKMKKEFKQYLKDEKNNLESLKEQKIYFADDKKFITETIMPMIKHGKKNIAKLKKGINPYNNLVVIDGVRGSGYEII